MKPDSINKLSDTHPSGPRTPDSKIHDPVLAALGRMAALLTTFFAALASFSIEVEDARAEGDDGSQPKPVAAGSAPPNSSSQPKLLPPLARVLELARTRAPEVQLGAEDVKVSRSALVNARRAPFGNPTLELLAERGVNPSAGSGSGAAGAGTTGSSTAINGTLWLPIEVAGQRGKRLGEANALIGLSQAGLDLLRANALSDAVSAYGSVVVAVERVRVFEAITQAAEATERIYAERVLVGDAVVRDLTLAKVELAKNQVLLQDAKVSVIDHFARLARVSGELYDGALAASLLPPRVPNDRSNARSTAGPPPAATFAKAEAAYFAAQKARWSREAVGPISLLLSGGRGEFGEARIGAGLAYEFPVVRANQGEQARAEAELQRSLVARRLIERQIELQSTAILEQLAARERAIERLVREALPAADAAVAAAIATEEAGKSDHVVVLLTQRDQALLRLERLELIERQWRLLADYVQLNGTLP
ncbi:MAG TPA: TolC family protein [Polyangiaceae bacterium]|nr:TolC family protein [Polyangiaceae bacterium]